MGIMYALIGAALATIGCGIGSALGVSYASQAAAGIIGEDPDKFGKTMVLQLIPSSNALYGFIVSFLIFMNTIMNSDVAAAGLPVEDGLKYLAVCLPIAIVGCISAVVQSKVCVAGIHMVGKRAELSGRAMVMAAFCEMFALLALVISIFGVFQI